LQTHHARWQAYEAKYPKATKGAGSRIAGLMKAFKLLHAAQGAGAGWIGTTSAHLSERAWCAQKDTGWNGQSRAQKGKRERSPLDHLQSTTLDISRRVGVGGMS